jgi:hypothetical protein
MEDYVRTHNAASIVRCSVRIYWQHFLVLVLSALIPMAPLLFIQVLRGPHDTIILDNVLLLLIGLSSVVPTAVIISDICAGNEPSVLRAYRRAFGKTMGRALATVAITYVLIIVGLVLFVVPGFIAAAWFTFAAIVSVLEGKAPGPALGRSRQLGKGHYLRILGIGIMIALLCYMPLLLVSVLASGFALVGEIPQHLSVLIGNFFGIIIAPIIVISVVLLYYDLRVQKEAYDSSRLAEDLRR